MNEILKIPFYQRRKNVPSPLKGLQLTPLNESFGKLTNPMVGTDSLRPIMGGNYFEPQTNSIVGTDAHKLYRLEMGSASKKFDGVYYTLQTLQKNYNAFDKRLVGGGMPFNEFIEKFGKIDGTFPKWEAVVHTEHKAKVKGVDVQKLWWFSTVLSKATFIEKEKYEQSGVDVNEYNQSKIMYLSDSYKKFLDKNTNQVVLTYKEDGEQKQIGFNSKFLSATTKFMLQLGQYFCISFLRNNNEAMLLGFEEEIKPTSSNYCLLMPTKLEQKEWREEKGLQVIYDLDNNTLVSNGKEYEITQELGFKAKKVSAPKTVEFVVKKSEKKEQKQNIIDKKIKVLKLLLGTKQGKFGGNKEIIEKKIKVLELINK